MDLIEIPLPNESATLRLAAKLASLAEPGQVISLVGDLGTGKTTFTRGFATQLGVPEEIVNSPTYLIQQDYPTSSGLILHHFDVYRLDNPDEFEMLGVGETFDSGGISIVEWADKAAESIPTDAWWIYLRQLPGEFGRVAELHLPESIIMRLNMSLFK